jgi:hypothetical protein
MSYRSSGEFAQRNVQDRLAAFGLAGLRAAPLRSSHRAAPRPPPEVRQISPDPEVRAWIDRLGGDLPLPSDLISPTLADSLAYIDRLEQVARDVPGGLWLGGTALRRLAAPGLGEVLAHRLPTPQQCAAVRDLLLDIARATDPYPALPATLDLVLDRGPPASLRRRALLLISQHGGDAYFCRHADLVARGPAGTPADRKFK